MLCKYEQVHTRKPCSLQQTMSAMAHVQDCLLLAGGQDSKPMPTLGHVLLCGREWVKQHRHPTPEAAQIRTIAEGVQDS